MSKGKTIRSTLFWYKFKHPLAWLNIVWSKLICKVFGHKRPFEQRLTAAICSRCCRIMSYYSPYSFRLTARRGSGG